MKVVVIGAGGFVGQKVAALLAADKNVASLTLVDQVPPRTPLGGAVTTLTGDLGDSALRARAFDGADAVIHLAAILGGAAEADYPRARRVNLDGTMDALDHLCGQNPKTRFVFASTIAVYAKPLPPLVTDATPLAPSMVYGAQKLMIEVAISNFAAKGWLDGVSLRPSGVLARDGADAGLKSAFISRLFWCIARGEDITLPVAEDSRTWAASVGNVAQNFAYALHVPDLGARRAFTLPALALRFGDLVAALRRRFPASAARVTYAPVPAIVALFGAYPDLETETADKLGFTRDADADALVAAAMI